MYMPREVMIAVRVPHGSLVQIEALADKSGMTVSKWAKAVVMRALANGPAMLTPGGGLAAPSAVSYRPTPRRQHGELGDENGSVAAYSEGSPVLFGEAKAHPVETADSPKGLVTTGWVDEGLGLEPVQCEVFRTPAHEIPPAIGVAWTVPAGWAAHFERFKVMQPEPRREAFNLLKAGRPLPTLWQSMKEGERIAWLDKEWPVC